jgi:hypothetical protein
MMTCVELALTAQLICFSNQTFVCTDNGSVAQLMGVSACTGPDQSQSDDDWRRVSGRRDVAIPVSTTGDNTSRQSVSPDPVALYEYEVTVVQSRLRSEVDYGHAQLPQAVKR